jgi:hypothetical protein
VLWGAVIATYGGFSVSALTWLFVSVCLFLFVCFCLLVAQSCVDGNVIAAVEKIRPDCFAKCPQVN